MNLIRKCENDGLGAHSNSSSLPVQLASLDCSHVTPPSSPIASQSAIELTLWKYLPIPIKKCEPIRNFGEQT